MPQPPHVERREDVAAAIEPLEPDAARHVEPVQQVVAAIERSQVHESLDAVERADIQAGAVHRGDRAGFVTGHTTVVVGVVPLETEPLESGVGKGDVGVFIRLVAFVVRKPAGRGKNQQERNRT